MKRDIQLIIPMSGIGKRFLDAGYSDPKPLIEVDGKPIIEHVLDMFNNPDDAIFICNEVHLAETNMKEILESLSPNCKIYSVPNENRRGPVDAVSKIFDKIDDDREVIVSYCDFGTYWNYEEFLKYTRELNADASIPCYTGFHPHMLGSDNYAFVKMDGNRALKIQEKKPFTNDKMSEQASNGAYYFKNGALVKKYFQKLIDSNLLVGGEFYVSEVNNLLIQDGLFVTTFLIEHMLQWGTPYDLEIYKGWSDYFKNVMQKQPIVRNPKNTKLILPMAGKGSRFSSDGYKLPKPLLPVDEKPMIIQAVDCLPQSYSNVFICLEEHSDEYKVDETILQNFPNSAIIVIDETTEGQACTCKIGIDNGEVNLEDPILISACDNGVYYDSSEYLKILNDETVDVIVWTFRNSQSSKVNANQYSWVDVDENNFAKFISCKKFIYDDPLKTHAIIGTMFFRKAKYFVEGFEENEKLNIRTNNEFYVDDVLNQNIKNGLKVKVFEVKNYICWGTPNDYKTYNYWQDFFDKCAWHPYKK